MQILYGILVFVYGLFITSFLQLVGERIPEKETLLGRSHCDQCHTTIKAHHLIPVMGYLLQKGRCVHCQTPILKRYVVLELLGGLLFLGAYLRFGFTAPFWVLALVLVVMIVEVAADLKHLVVIDRVWLLGLVPLVVWRLYEGTFWIYFYSSIGLFLVLYLIAFLALKVYKQEALGGGDIKLYLFIGFALPFLEGLLTLFFAALFGTLYGLKMRHKNTPMAFVPWIALAVYVVFLFGSDMITWYVSFLEG